MGSPGSIDVKTSQKADGAHSHLWCPRLDTGPRCRVPPLRRPYFVSGHSPRSRGGSVEAREVPHKGGRTLGYRVSGGHAALAYIPDYCPTVLGPGPDGWGEYHQAALDLAAGVDLLVHDASLLPHEVASEASFGHAVADYAVRLGELAGARRVLLAHHKHDRTDEALDSLAARFRKGPAEVMVAAEGTIFDL